MKRAAGHQHGITLIELVITILVIGIMSGIASVKFGFSDITLAQQAEQFAADIRHARSLAINWGCELSLTVTTPDQYEVSSKQAYAGKPCDVVGTIKDQISGRDFVVNLANGVQFTANATFHFDSFGRPIDEASSIINNDTSFDMTTGNQTYRITVTQLSGYVSTTRL